MSVFECSVKDPEIPLKTVAQTTPQSAADKSSLDLRGNGHLLVGATAESNLERSIALAIFLLSLLYLCLFRRFSWIDPDEGIILQGAQRILDGQVPYRDFFSFFTPGSYYLWAAIFRIFGDSYLVAHTALAIVGAAFSPITYLLARRVCSRQTSLLITGLMTITAVPCRFVVIHNWDSTLWTCLALYSAVRLLESPSMLWSFFAATFTSLTALSEQSKGAGLLLGLAAGFLVIVLSGERRKLFTSSQLIAATLGLSWPFLFTAIYFAWHHAFASMMASWFWPLQHYSAANHVPYAFDNGAGETREKIFGTRSLGMRLFTQLIFSSRVWIPYVPLLAIVLLVCLGLQRLRKRPMPPQWSLYILLSAAISGLLLSIVVSRADYLHFTFLQPVFFLVLAWLLDGRGFRHPMLVRSAPILGLFLSMSLVARAAQSLVTGRGDFSVDTRRGLIAMQAPDQTIAYIQANTTPGERILIYPYQPTYYYLTETYSPTRFDFYQPGMHTQQQLQEMLDEFSAHPTKIVLFEPRFNQHLREAWPNTPSNAIARDVMAEYIEREYQVCGTVGSEIELMIRNNAACPSEKNLSR